MRKPIYKEQMKKVKVNEDILCDICQQKIDDKKGYYFVRMGHNDWGNDSGDSAESFDICDSECLYKLFDAYIGRSEGVFNTEYFEVEHRAGYVTGLTGKE